MIQLIKQNLWDGDFLGWNKRWHIGTTIARRVAVLTTGSALSQKLCDVRNVLIGLDSSIHLLNSRCKRRSSRLHCWWSFNGVGSGTGTDQKTVAVADEWVRSSGDIFYKVRETIPNAKFKENLLWKPENILPGLISDPSLRQYVIALKKTKSDFNTKLRI
jgi:hypothetical protein